MMPQVKAGRELLEGEEKGQRMRRRKNMSASSSSSSSFHSGSGDSATDGTSSSNKSIAGHFDQLSTASSNLTNPFELARSTIS